jgi:hypothetical protein
MFVEGRGPSTHIRSRFPLHPSLSAVDGASIEGKVKIDGTIQRADDTPKQGEWKTPLGGAARGEHKDVVAFLHASGAQE